MNKGRILQFLRDKRVPGYGAATVLVLLFLGTVAVLQLDPPARQRRVFWFPDTTRTRMNAEFRFVPRRDSQLQQIMLYLDDLALGPSRMGSVPVFPRDARIVSVVLDERGRLFLDFSPRLAVYLEGGETSLEDLTDAIIRNVQHNFPYLSEIVFTIGGQVPNVPRFGNPALTKGHRPL